MPGDECLLRFPVSALFPPVELRGYGLDISTERKPLKRTSESIRAEGCLMREAHSECVFFSLRPVNRLELLRHLGGSSAGIGIANVFWNRVLTVNCDASKPPVSQKR
jgi:hypothetical protein